MNTQTNPHKLCADKRKFPFCSDFVSSLQSNTCGSESSLFFRCERCQSFLVCSTKDLKAQCPVCFFLYAIVQRKESKTVRRVLQYSEPSALWETVSLDYNFVSHCIDNKKVCLYKAKKCVAHNYSSRSNPYFNFCSRQRKALKSSYPRLTFKEIGSLLGKIWRSMTSEEKAYFK